MPVPFRFDFNVIVGRFLKLQEHQIHVKLSETLSTPNLLVTCDGKISTPLIAYKSRLISGSSVVQKQDLRSRQI